MLSLESNPFQQSLADFGIRQKSGLARGSDWVSISFASGNPPRVPTDAHQDHTPSLCGQRADRVVSLPDFFAGWGMGPEVGQNKTKNAALHELGKAQQYGQAYKSSEGTGICLFGTSFWGSPHVQALPLAATLWANRPLAVASSARVPQRSPAVASFKARQSVRQAISPIVSLTPANVAGTDTRRPFHRLTSGDRAQNRPVSLGIGHSTHAHRAALADAALRVSLKTQKDSPCSRKS